MGAAEAFAGRVREALGEAWIPEIYRARILTTRTRAHRIEAAASASTLVEIQHTLLGVELKVGRRRLSCPDLATARYLAVFARAGCAHVAVPYDITGISRLADELDSAWHRMLLLVEQEAEGRSKQFRSRARTRIIEGVRQEIELAGAGSPVPQFNQNTRQRPRRAGEG